MKIFYPRFARSRSPLSLFLITIYLLTLPAFPVKAAEDFFLTEGEQAYIEEKKTLKVAVLDHWLPFSAKAEEDGTYRGLIIDLLEKLAQNTSLSLEYIEAANYEAAATLVEQGEADLMLAVGYPQADNPYDIGMTKPYLNSQMLLLYNKNTELGKLTDFAAAEVKGYPLFSDNPKLSPMSFATPRDCLLAIRAGEADIMYCDMFSGMSYLQRYENRDLVSLPLDTTTLFSFGISPKETASLRPILNRLIEQTSREEINNSLTHNRLNNSYDLGDFVYHYPFEILCVSFILGFLVVLSFLTYLRIKNHQKMLSHGYLESYGMLADAFGDACFHYDYMEDRMTVFGTHADRLSMAPEIENFSVYLQSPEKEISLTKEQLERVFTKNGSNSSSLEISCRLREGGWQHFELIYSVLSTDVSYQRPISIIGCLKNVEEKYREKERLIQLGFYDKLTGIFNRAGVEAELERYLKNAASMEEDILMILDVDFFKRFNDAYGHGCGDDVLAYIARQMKRIFTTKDILCRWGGDEFLLYFIGGASHMEQTKKKCHALQRALKGYQYEQKNIPVTLSMGGMVVGQHSLEEAFAGADRALYQVKENGRNGLHIIKE